MTQLSASIRLRPVRIGFLVKPTDMVSIRKIMRASACLWGGLYNPIIPVAHRLPKAWREPHRRSMSARDVARGYVRFFEPDVFVEASPGMAEQIGLAGVSDLVGGELLTLDEFMTPQSGRSWAEPGFGLPVTDVLRQRYQDEQQFVRRDPRQALVITANQQCAASEAIVGCYPAASPVEYFERSYRDVYNPIEVDWSPDTWLKLLRDGAICPLSVTSHDLDKRRYWHHEPSIFVFDPNEPADIIDLWNLRLEPSPVLPVPVAWVDSIGDFLREVISQQYRPLEGNSHGVMHHTTMEFARSINEEAAKEILATFARDIPQGSLSTKLWRTPVWREHRETMVTAPTRMQITAEESSVSLQVSNADKERLATFRKLRPSFASKYGYSHASWVNALNVSSYTNDDVGCVIPFNTFDRRWPRLQYVGGERVPVGSEGWIFKEHVSLSEETLQLPSMDDIVQGALRARGIEAQLSEPGRIAKQMLQRLGGLWGTHLLRDQATLKLLNKMAVSLRRRSSEVDSIEESFAGRTASLGDWKMLVKDRTKRDHSRLSIDEFTKRDVIRVGIETACPHCKFKNWSGLDKIDYKISCDRCLNAYDFPQGDIARNSANFRYRVVGPFAVPDYGLGSYGSILSLNAISGVGALARGMTFSTATELRFDSKILEADFVAIKRNENGDCVHTPDIIIGECKSFGDGELVKSDDLEKLRAICSKLPGAIAVISVLRDGFTDEEKRLITKFVEWARRPDADGYPTNPTLLLTGHELFANMHLHSSWKNLGGAYASHVDFHQTKDLRSLAESTQAIHLGLPSQHQWLRQRRPRSRLAR